MECVVCTDTALDTAVTCSARAHAVCETCMPAFLQHSDGVSARPPYAFVVPCNKYAGDHAPCTCVFNAESILHSGTPATRTAFCDAFATQVARRTERALVMRAPQTAPPVDEFYAHWQTNTSADETAAWLLRFAETHRLHARVHDALNVRCPSCSASFRDYSGCDALTCASCGVAFCAACFVACGIDAHAHVAANHNGGAYYVRSQDEVHRRFRARTMAQLAHVLERDLRHVLLAWVALATTLGVEDAHLAALTRVRLCLDASEQERTTAVVRAVLERLPNAQRAVAAFWPLMHLLPCARFIMGTTGDAALLTQHLTLMALLLDGTCVFDAAMWNDLLLLLPLRLLTTSVEQSVCAPLMRFFGALLRCVERDAAFGGDALHTHRVLFAHFMCHHVSDEDDADAQTFRRWLSGNTQDQDLLRGVLHACVIELQHPSRVPASARILGAIVFGWESFEAYVLHEHMPPPLSSDATAAALDVLFDARHDSTALGAHDTHVTACILMAMTQHWSCDTWPTTLARRMDTCWFRGACTAPTDTRILYEACTFVFLASNTRHFDAAVRVWSREAYFLPVPGTPLSSCELLGALVLQCDALSTGAPATYGTAMMQLLVRAAARWLTVAVAVDKADAMALLRTLLNTLREYNDAVQHDVVRAVHVHAPHFWTRSMRAACVDAACSTRSARHALSRFVAQSRCALEPRASPVQRFVVMSALTRAHNVCADTTASADAVTRALQYLMLVMAHAHPTDVQLPHNRHARALRDTARAAWRRAVLELDACDEAATVLQWCDEGLSHAVPGVLGMHSVFDTCVLAAGLLDALSATRNVPPLSDAQRAVLAQPVVRDQLSLPALCVLQHAQLLEHIAVPERLRAVTRWTQCLAAATGHMLRVAASEGAIAHSASTVYMQQHVQLVTLAAQLTRGVSAASDELGAYAGALQTALERCPYVPVSWTPYDNDSHNAAASVEVAWMSRALLLLRRCVIAMPSCARTQPTVPHWMAALRAGAALIPAAHARERPRRLLSWHARLFPEAASDLWMDERAWGVHTYAFMYVDTLLGLTGSACAWVAQCASWLASALRAIAPFGACTPFAAKLRTRWLHVATHVYARMNLGDAHTFFAALWRALLCVDKGARVTTFLIECQQTFGRGDQKRAAFVRALLAGAPDMSMDALLGVMSESADALALAPLRAFFAQQATCVTGSTGDAAARSCFANAVAMARHAQWTALEHLLLFMRYLVQHRAQAVPFARARADIPLARAPPSVCDSVTALYNMLEAHTRKHVLGASDDSAAHHSERKRRRVRRSS